jgi:16S rRNA (adenine1518-N6/adenine1519-N6)-dimethyltransferase
MVEIGPGWARMTRPLSARLDRLHVIEIDRDLAARLREGDLAGAADDPPAGRIEVRFFGAGWEHGAALRVVGNLPYNISTPAAVPPRRPCGDT